MVLQLDLSSLDKWVKVSTRPFVISGPCSAETEDQVMETAIQLAKVNEVSVFRAGIWKPRTRPGSFEGVGSKGLKWLRKVKEETGFVAVMDPAKRLPVAELNRMIIEKCQEKAQLVELVQEMPLIGEEQRDGHAVRHLAFENLQESLS